ncbi:hypothetical protein RRG08_023845 [Elysia crispata]|uniref:Uncharacterized protein n=1 Tax=Elysia crispata TaxID=231223 RepID=A0AAE1AV95_9GAST|nr:hypothetical protein RRG08_023845 [Elysia crispata]
MIHASRKHRQVKSTIKKHCQWSLCPATWYPSWLQPSLNRVIPAHEPSQWPRTGQPTMTDNKRGSLLRYLGGRLSIFLECRRFAIDTGMQTQELHTWAYTDAGYKLVCSEFSESGDVGSSLNSPSL